MMPGLRPGPGFWRTAARQAGIGSKPRQNPTSGLRLALLLVLMGLSAGLSGRAADSAAAGLAPAPAVCTLMNDLPFLP